MKSNHLIKFCTLIAVLYLWSCCYADATEKEEKLRAMEFLIKNMDRCYSYDSENIRNYYASIMETFQSQSALTNDQYRTAYATAIRKYPFMTNNCDTIYDSQKISQDYLYQNIEEAYLMWKRNSPQISFDTFCNYILPYRIGHEPISEWRNKYIKKYSTTSSSEDIQKNYYDIFRIYKRLNNGFNSAVYYPTTNLPEFSLADLSDMKLGNCESYSIRSVAQLRAFGIPATIDFVPQWGNRSMGHTWAVMFVTDTYTLPFGINEPLGMHFCERQEQAIPKVYRKTFSRQSWLKDICIEKNTYVPPIFRDERFIDVTDIYVKTSDITIDIEKEQLKSKVKWLYLGVFNNQEWIPIAFTSTDKDGKATFRKLGGYVVYIAFYYDTSGNRQYITHPFVIDNNGHTSFFKPSHNRISEITIARKYRETNVLKEYNKNINNGQIFLANNETFNDSILILNIDNIKENRFYTFALDKYEGKYRFLKYVSPQNSFGNIAEIEMYDDSENRIRPVRCFGSSSTWSEHNYEKVFDGNELTYFTRLAPNGAWAAAEFAKAEHISKIRIHPRTDGNAIYSGDIYQLRYWDNGKWITISEKEAGNNDKLTFENVPENALLILHNKSRGSEERIFVYKGGQQIWW